MPAVHVRGVGLQVGPRLEEPVVEVQIEVMRLHNASAAAVDPGPEGLKLPLPADAFQAQAGEETPALSVTTREAIYRGPIPPGDTQLHFGSSRSGA